MGRLSDFQKQTDALTPQERESLLLYLLESLPDAPEGPEDQEVREREAAMESGAIKPLSEEEFFRQVGRKK